MHLFWDLDGRFAAAEVTLTVTEPPRVDRLYFWALQASVASDKLAKGGDEKPEFYKAKIATARFYFAKLLPEVEALKATIKGGAKPLMTLADEHFAF